MEKEDAQKMAGGGGDMVTGVMACCCGLSLSGAPVSYKRVRLNFQRES